MTKQKEIIEKFQLGYSPKQKDALTKQAIKDSYQKEFLEESGLSFFNEKGSADRFRERVIFPIHNYSGKVLGFGGRALNPKNKAKYLNSPENLIYHKSKVLYGLYGCLRQPKQCLFSQRLPSESMDLQGSIRFILLPRAMINTFVS